MSPESFKRKLTAILSADVKGYSRLMGENEAETVKTLTAYRKIMGELIEQHRGRVIDSPGDNILAEFGSVVDAVQCSVAVQNEFKARNSEVPESRRMVFRIGVNLGDVIEEEGRIYGDGVNIAARLEALAEPGGICISKTAFDHIESKLPLGYQFLGEQTVKNIAKPVGAYKVLMEPRVLPAEEIKKAREVPFWRRKLVLTGVVAALIVVIGVVVWNFYGRAPKFEPASKEKMAYPLPDKPSIAVLPFDNISGDLEQNYLADGITENIISYLSKHPAMFVIDRKSTFTYKGKHVKAKQVSEDLGVRYILEGSVQKSGNKLRVTAQLVDALMGHHLWSDRYDRDFQDLFALQDEITVNILKATGVQLTGRQIAFQYNTTNIEAWGLAVKGNSLSAQGMKETNLEARALLEKAVKLDPSYAFAWNGLAWTYIAEAWFGWSDSRAESLKRAMELVQKQEATGKSGGALHTTMNVIYMFQGKYEEAIAEGEKAVALEPNEANHYARLGTVLRTAGRADEAIANMNKAMRLNPHYPAWYLFDLGGAYEILGQYNEALATWNRLLERSLKGESNPLLVHQWLVITYARLGQMEKARAHAENILKLNPKYTVEFFRKSTPYKDQTYLDGLVSLLIKAGLPEKAPLPLPDKPSIAVLPFVNMSEDKSQEFFGDGLTEEIITALSKTPKLFVIARNSTFVYKGKSVNVQQVSRELGVKYVLEGSVRRSGDQLRITAQLIDATTGNHLWAERYDREMKDVFAIQDEITMKIINALAVTLTQGEKANLLARSPKNLEAYLKYLQGLERFNRMNKEDNTMARKLFEEATEMGRNFAVAYVYLGWTYYYDLWLGSGSSPADSIMRAFEAAKTSIALEDSLPDAHCLLSFLYGMRRQHDDSIKEAEEAVTLNPNSALGYVSLGSALFWSGKTEEAIVALERGVRLDPVPPSIYLAALAMAYRDAGRYEEAIAVSRKAIIKEPNNVIAYVVLASTYSMLNRVDEARTAAAEILRIDPSFSLDRFAKIRPHIDTDNTARFADSLRKAGLK